MRLRDRLPRLARTLAASVVLILGPTLLIGQVATLERIEISGNQRSQVQVSTSLEPDAVAIRAVAAMRNGRRTIVTGLANKLSSGAVRFLPRRLQAVVARKVLE